MTRKPRAVVFDCDGVLLASNRLKTAIFEQVLQGAGFAAADVARFRVFQRANFGMSRYRLFDALLGWQDLSPYPATSRDALCAAYGSALYARYVRCPATPGMVGVLRQLQDAGVPLFVVSGSDGAELAAVFAERGLARWFAAIHGSPATKVDNLALVAAQLGIRAPMPEVVFVGDAEADWKAAAATGCRFIYADHFSTAKRRMRALAAETGFPTIRDLRGLVPLL
ncbi:HAD family hydrolase [Paeniroseomonas aquatica]|uniref:phosphoglycolate phosphatase n=1 Tax=Paeniroseomonas aquatica TaxID=373043 RepID=A0ABT8ADI2_9PROT|nr:HAD family hydrolase [Paeniroseomonas aquatica]MDN3567526.1 HAD hydrolase-like protein [Paeniroseomonas aquatica]